MLLKKRAGQNVFRSAPLQRVQVLDQTTGAPRALKMHLHGELKNARVVGAGCLSEGRGIQTLRESSEARTRRLPGRGECPHEVCMVQNVERFGTHLQTEALVELKGPAQSDVEPEVLGPAHAVALDVPDT